jgi:Flp pilus assembly protein TadG
MSVSTHYAAIHKAVASTGQKSGRLGDAESGSAMVDFALSSAVIFALFFGIIQFGYALYTFQFVNEVARELTRYAIVRGSACSSSSSMPNCGFSDSGATLQTYARSAYNYPGINSSQVTVTSEWFSPVPNADETVSSFASCSGSGCNKPGNAVKVTVTYPFLLSIPFWRATTLSVSSSSTMVISQ